MNERYCDLCDYPLNGHCVYMPGLGIFCEKCIRKALKKALDDWDKAAEQAAEQDE